MGDKPVADLVFITSKSKGQDTRALQDVEKVMESRPGTEPLRKCFRQILFMLSDLPKDKDMYEFAPPWVFFWTMLRSGLPERGYKYFHQARDAKPSR